TAAATGGHIAFLQSASGAGPTGIAAVDPGGRLVLAVRNLPPTTGSQVYEAWVIGSAGPPVPAGSFTVGGAETGTLQVAIGANPGSVAVAITREPGPGATTPTLPIIVQGQPQPAGA
ncbi:MAG TPA: anti-sigma factor, partial [Candidatus Limnocylindrales bacterium]|nr:anti-sigma factor [Candidatus Limnocylindrales bacterium]